MVGLPDDDWGEAVTAFVVADTGQTLDTQHRLNHCRSRLSKYKVPKHIVIVENLPIAAYDKTDKKRLRQHMF